MTKIKKTSIRHRRYTNPEILYDNTKSKLYYFTSSIRDAEKYFKGEVKGYTLEEVMEHLEEFKKI